MRTFFKLICVSLTLLLGCETNPILFKGPYFVRFTESSITLKESYSKPIVIQVHNAGPAASEDIVISYKTSGSAREGTDFSITTSSPGQITIPKGEFFGSIEVQLINNANNIIRSQDIVLTLQSVNAGLQIGQGESAIGQKYVFTILDDCILGGDYIAQRGPVAYAVTLTSSDCEIYLLSNWNIGVFVSPVAMDLRFIDNGDNTLTIPDQEEENLSEEQATIRGTGVVDPVTRKIILTITLVDFVNQPQVTITLLPD